MVSADGNEARSRPARRVIELLLASGKLFDNNPAFLLYLVSESIDDSDVMHRSGACAAGALGAGPRRMPVSIASR